MCNDIEAPDYSQMSSAISENTEIMRALGTRQLDFAERQYNDMLPVYQGISDAQIRIMDQQQAQGEDYYDYNVETFRPVERGLVSDAQDFNTAGYRETLAAQAAADAGLAFSNTQDANARTLRSMGVNPNSGKYQSVNAQAGLQHAAGTAAIMNGTRQTAEQTAWARRMDAAGIGRNLPGASAAAYGGAVNAGNSAGTNAATPGQQYVSNTAAGVNTTATAGGMQLDGLSSSLNSQASMYGQQQAGIGQAVGMIAGAGIMAASDRRLKENIKKVGFDERTKLNIYQFNYLHDDRVFEGVMAHEVLARYPDAVSTGPQGYLQVDYGKLGLTMQEVA